MLPSQFTLSEAGRGGDGEEYCETPAPEGDDPYGDDPYGEDCYYDGPDDYEPEKPPTDLRPGQSIDDWLDAFCDREYQRAADNAAGVLPVDGEMRAIIAAADARRRQPQRSSETEQQRSRRLRHERELAAGPPPRREEQRYGPLCNKEGDERFRNDRREWYELYTGESIAGVSLRGQNEVCDAIARRFRQYTDSRASV